MRIGINARQLLGNKDGVGYYISYLIRNLMDIDKCNEYVIFLPKNDLLNLENKNFRMSLIKFPTYSKLSRGFWEHFLLPLESIVNKIDLIHCLADISPFIGKI